MYTLLLICHVLIAIVLVVVVLLQSGKGGGLGAGFGGGGANTLFGSSGGSNFFTKLTMALAAGFMITSLSLTTVKTRELRTSIFDQAAPLAPKDQVPEAPPSQPTAPSPEHQPSGVPPVQPGAVPPAQPGSR